MELHLLRARIREEPQITLVRFQSGLNYEIQVKVELLPYNDLNDLVQFYVSVEHQIIRRPTSRKDYSITSSPMRDSKREG